MNQNNKLHSVHFLRFVASLGVVIFHLTFGLGGTIAVGAAGVDIFFIISGLVIGLSIASGEDSVTFALKRIVRVMPLYWLATLLYFAVSHFAWGNSPDSFTLVRSLFLWPEFGTNWHPVYYPAWTLEYEMFFYGVAAASIGLFGRRAAIVCLVGMLALSSVNVPVPHSEGNFLTNFFLEFCAGIGLSMLIKRLSFDRRTGVFLVVAGLFMLAMNYKANDIIRPLAWGVPAAMLVCGGLAFDRVTWLSSPLTLLAGNISYALYLTHVSTIEMLQYIARRLGSHFMDSQWSAVLIAAPVCVLIAIAVHRFVEAPMLRVLRFKMHLARSRPDRPIAPEGTA